MRKNKRKKPRLRKTNHTMDEFFQLCADFGFICVICQDEFHFYEFTRDHIRPTSQGGCDYIWNIQPTCAECNHFKGDRYGDFRPFIPSWVSSRYESYRKKNRK